MAIIKRPDSMRTTEREPNFLNMLSSIITLFGVVALIAVVVKLLAAMVSWIWAYDLDKIF